MFIAFSKIFGPNATLFCEEFKDFIYYSEKFSSGDTSPMKKFLRSNWLNENLSTCNCLLICNTRLQILHVDEHKFDKE